MMPTVVRIEAIAQANRIRRMVCSRARTSEDRRLSPGGFGGASLAASRSAIGDPAPRSVRGLGKSWAILERAGRGARQLGAGFGILGRWKRQGVHLRAQSGTAVEIEV